MTNNVMAKKLIYIVYMMFVINVHYSVFNTEYSYYFAMAFAAFGLILVGKIDRVLKEAILAYVVPITIITVLSLFTALFIHQTKNFSDLTQSTWRWILYVCAFIIAYCSVKWFGKEAIKLFIYSGFLSYLTVIVKYIMNAGISGLLHPFNNSVNGVTLEVHDLTYCYGLCFLYYLFSEDQTQKEKMKMCALLIFAIFLGNKRTLYLSLFVTIGFYFLFYRFEKKKTRWIMLVFCFLIFSAFFYVWLIKSGQLQLLFEYLGINDNSRLKFWNYFQDSYEFSLDYWGRGISYTDLVMAEKQTMSDLRITIVTLLHNDILRAYIGWGFLPFLYYLCNFFLLRIPFFQKNGGKEIVWKYCIYAIYTFVLYFFDNMILAVGYNVTFFILYFILLSEVLNKNNKVIRIRRNFVG